VLECGICGTDREIVNGLMHEASPPPGYSYLVLGHEAIGVLEEDGEFLRKGDVVARKQERMWTMP
jgi:aldose 1-dehydrogenase [NAD(P)+]